MKKDPVSTERDVSIDNTELCRNLVVEVLFFTEEEVGFWKELNLFN